MVSKCQRSSYINCKANQALYTAFNVERLLKINISEITDIKKYGIDKILDDLKNINFKIENVTLLTPEARNLINQLKDGTKNLNFTSFLDELDKNITQIDLRPIVDDLRTFSQPTTDELAKTLETIANTTVGSIEEEPRVNVPTCSVWPRPSMRRKKCNRGH